MENKDTIMQNMNIQHSENKKGRKANTNFHLLGIWKPSFSGILLAIGHASLNSDDSNDRTISRSVGISMNHLYDSKLTSFASDIIDNCGLLLNV